MSARTTHAATVAESSRWLAPLPQDRQIAMSMTPPCSPAPRPRPLHASHHRNRLTSAFTIPPRDNGRPDAVRARHLQAVRGQGRPEPPLTPYDLADAVYAAARLLCANGAPGNLHQAIFAYNHAIWYVTEVLNWAERYATPVGTAAEIASFAVAQIGKPYKWGATGPDAFDCSGLTMMAYRAAGISIPRTSQEQWAFGRKIPAAQAEPGDLVFYEGADGTSAAPGHVGIVYTATTMIVAPTTGQDVQIQPINQPGLVGFTDPASNPSRRGGSP